MISSLISFFSRLNLVCAIAGAAILFMVTMIVFVEVASRALFGTSQLWVIEVSEYSLLYITFLGAPYLLEKNMHVTLDLVYESLPLGRKVVARIASSTLGFAVCGVLTVVGIGVVADQIGSGVRQVTVLSPQSYYITAILPLGMFLMAVQFLKQCIEALGGKGL